MYNMHSFKHAGSLVGVDMPPEVNPDQLKRKLEDIGDEMSEEE
jgi:hypothetical protein